MEVFLYIIIFIIGTFFGSFFTLAVYRIPRKEDILIKHSYCPNCNSKLGFFDLFPILSYIFLGGKCRYCKSKIRPRYLILEVFTGVAFLILAIGIKVNISDIHTIINISFLLLYVSILFIIAGIDKESIKIEKSVLVFGFILELIYIIYQYTLGNFNVYQYVMYFSICAMILLLYKFLKADRVNIYAVQNIWLSLYMIIFSGIEVYIFTILISLIISLIYKNVKKQKENQIPFGFYFCICNIVVIALSNIIGNYVI